jgi:hypothetical protein
MKWEIAAYEGQGAWLALGRADGPIPSRRSIRGWRGMASSISTMACALPAGTLGSRSAAMQVGGWCPSI